MARLSTHVLDTAHGVPAIGVRIELYARDKDSPRLISANMTNQDGRTPEPLLQGDSIPTGLYELVFYAGDYFRSLGLPLREPAFLDQIRIAFGIADSTGNYHVPLLLSPYGYTTYRGS